MKDPKLKEGAKALRRARQAQSTGDVASDPTLGITLPVGKINPSGSGEAEPYRFSLNNKVKPTGTEIPDAAETAIRKQMGVSADNMTQPQSGGSCKD